MNRLIVGHTHFDVDQRHSVLSRFLLGVLKACDRGRRALHSLSAFKKAVHDAHSDLRFFSECTANYDFTQWLSCMESKHEPGLSTHLQYQLRRVGSGVIMARSKPRMSCHVSYSTWYQIWPVDQSHWPSSKRRPTAPAWDSKPAPQQPQPWKNWSKIRASLNRFYSNEWWGVNAADKYEMTRLLRQWGNNPSIACPDPPEWPDFTAVMPCSAVPLSRAVDPPRRPTPLLLAPYTPLAMPRRRKGRGRARGRKKGRGRRGRGRARGRARGKRRGRKARARGKGKVSVSKGEVTGAHSDGSSVDEPLPPRKRSRVHRIISTSSSSDTDDDPLITWVGGANKHPVGTKIRKKFGNNRCFNGVVVSFDRTEKEWPWHVKYSDGDSEDLSENELKECVQLYNTCNNE